MRIAVLMTCHNRMPTTVACLKALKAQSIGDTSIHVYLVDDGSTDKTASEVRQAFPEIRILLGDGSLYWCGGTEVAFETALKENFDVYMWLNDDTVLTDRALPRLIEVYRECAALNPAVIVVGSTFDPDTGAMSYGGWRRVAGRSWGLTNSWKKISPDPHTVVECDTINGNCVLISREVTQSIGTLDRRFRQGLGDLDYGLRAKTAGCQVFIAPGFYGACRRNSGAGSWTDPNLTRYQRWRQLLGPKGLPPRAWGAFVSRHKGPLWPLAWISPYILVWLR